MKKHTFIERGFVILILLTFSIISVAEGYIKPFAQTSTNPVPWWVAKKLRMENIEFVDHLGHTNLVRRPIGGGTANVRGTSRWGGNYAIITPELVVTNYVVGGADFERGWSILNVAPGSYDLVAGTWYGDMTDEQKTACWVSYTNSVIQARNSEEAERNAPAKFDVSKTPEEYETFLLRGRDKADVDPCERRFIAREVGKYRNEWTRINEPDKYSSPDMRKMMLNYDSEQTKLRRRGKARFPYPTN